MVNVIVRETLLVEKRGWERKTQTSPFVGPEMSVPICLMITWSNIKISFPSPAGLTHSTAVSCWGTSSPVSCWQEGLPTAQLTLSLDQNLSLHKTNHIWQNQICPKLQLQRLIWQPPLMVIWPWVSGVWLLFLKVMCSLLCFFISLCGEEMGGGHGSERTNIASGQFLPALRLHRGFNHLIPLLVPWAAQPSAATIVPGSKAIPKDMFHSERWVCPNRTQTGLVLGVWGYCSLSCPMFFFSTLELNSALDITASPAGPPFFLMEVRDVFWAHNGGKVVLNYPCTVCAKDLALQKLSGTMKSPSLTYQEVPWGRLNEGRVEGIHEILRSENESMNEWTEYIFKISQTWKSKESTICSFYIILGQFLTSLLNDWSTLKKNVPALWCCYSLVH